MQISVDKLHLIESEKVCSACVPHASSNPVDCNEQGISELIVVIRTSLESPLAACSHVGKVRKKIYALSF